VSDLSTSIQRTGRLFGFSTSRVNWFRFIADWGVQFDMPVAAGRCGGGDARASSPAIKNSRPGARQSPTFRPDHRSPRAPGRVVTFLIPADALSILRCKRSPSDFRNACGFRSLEVSPSGSSIPGRNPDCRKSALTMIAMLAVLAIRIARESMGRRATIAQIRSPTANPRARIEREATR